MMRCLLLMTAVAAYICAFTARGDTTPTLGIVVLEFYVDEKGVPTNIRVVESPDPRYTEAAIRGVQKWTLDKKFRKQTMKVPVHFIVSADSLPPPVSLKRKLPNKSPEPTPTAVTPRASETKSK